MKKVMFLCTANSCRSQMAEGFAREFGKGLVEVHSAGLIAAGIHKRAIAVMDEIGIDISNQKSKIIDEYLLRQMDIVVTLCGHAEVLCPFTPPEINRIHWPINDPVGTVGTEEEIMNEFRHARDEIKEKVKKLIEEIATPSGGSISKPVREESVTTIPTIESPVYESSEILQAPYNITDIKEERVQKVVEEGPTMPKEVIVKEIREVPFISGEKLDIIINSITKISQMLKELKNMASNIHFEIKDMKKEQKEINVMLRDIRNNSEKMKTKKGWFRFS